MKLYNISDVDKFFDVVGACKGSVELVTKEGDRLNLKSQLCKFIAFSSFLTEVKMDELEIIASEPEDLNRLVNFMAGGDITSAL